MRQIPEPYNTLRSQTGSYYEVKVIRGATTYGMDKLKSIKIKQALFEDDGPQVGGASSTTCEVHLLENSENWPRTAKFNVQIRLSSEDGSTHSIWFSVGKFYTDQRKGKNGNLKIIGYDLMLKTEQPWTDKVNILPEEWPITAQAAANLLHQAIGIEYDEQTVLDDTTPYIGLDTTSTARDVLKSIAAGCGGNWCVTSDEKFRLVPLNNIHHSVNTAIAGIAVAGVAVVGISGTSFDYTVVDRAIRNFDACAELMPITGVEVQSSNGTIAFDGDRSGYVLHVSCDYADAAIANTCLQTVVGHRYRPFEATAARIDPIAEVGDYAFVDGKLYPIVTINWNIAPKITADISAPFEEEIDHEYTMQSESAKALRKSMEYTDGQIESTRSYIQQTERSIMQGVEATYVSDDTLAATLQDYSPTAQIQQNYYNKTESDTQADALASEIELTDNRLTLAFTQLRADTENAINSMTYYIRYENGVVIVGKTDDPFSFRISNSKISLYYNNQEMSYWDNQKQYTPNELQIPTGGKFTLGKILCQPRSSGNMSWMWVGT